MIPQPGWDMLAFRRKGLRNLLCGYVVWGGSAQLGTFLNHGTAPISMPKQYIGAEHRGHSKRAKRHSQSE